MSAERNPPPPSAGLLNHIAGHVPTAGEHLEYGGLRFEILEANQRKVLRLRGPPPSRRSHRKLTQIQKPLTQRTQRNPESVPPIKLRFSPAFLSVLCVKAFSDASTDELGNQKRSRSREPADHHRLHRTLERIDPVKRPFTQPNTASASSVTPTEK